MAMQTSNPVLTDAVLNRTARRADERAMTMQGTVNKAGLTILVCIAAAIWSWNSDALNGIWIVAALVAFGLAIWLSFSPKMAPVLTLPYAVLEGVVLGGISKAFDASAPGIVFSAVSLTLITTVVMLGLYRSKIIVASEKLRFGIGVAMISIVLLYAIDLGVMLFAGHGFAFLRDASALSIGISFVIVGVAALNLILDFDRIETQARSGRAPAYMEWYGAFALLVTLVWLYLEILRLISKLSRRD